jgi:hypothetical protein
VIGDASDRHEAQDDHMRGLISGICVAGALLLTAALMFMNWSFWAGQGADASAAQVLGAVSIGIDVFKASLPLVIAWAWSARLRLGCAIGIVFFCGCLAFSLFSAIGFAASSRGAVTGSREAVSLRYQAAEQELREIKERVASLGTIRPRAVIEAAIARAKQERSWSSSNECKDATTEASRAFCRSIGDLGVELAKAVEIEGLQERSPLLETEIDNLLAAGARNDQDHQAGLLARLTGFGVGGVQTSIVVLFAALVEFGSAFGLFLALLPMRGFPRLAANARESHEATEIEAVLAPRPIRRDGPTRFARAADGQLMIE